MDVMALRLFLFAPGSGRVLQPQHCISWRYCHAQVESAVADVTMATVHAEDDDD